jgi:hypothetical protein
MVYFPNIGRALIHRDAPIVAGRVKGMRVARVLRRVWIPLVVLVVIGCGGLALARVHGIFGSEKHPPDAESQVADAGSFYPKHVIYEVFGPARLPWSVKITTTLPSVVGDIVAQDDRNSIGGRIVVDSNEDNAYIHCLGKYA